MSGETGLRWRWERAFREAEFTTATKAIGLVLATFANSDGSKAHPGAARLARGAGVTTRTVSTAMTTLGEAGWIARVSHAVPQAGRAGEYRLTIPATGEVTSSIAADTGEVMSPTSSATGEASDAIGETSDAIGEISALTRVNSFPPTGSMTRPITGPMTGPLTRLGTPSGGAAQEHDESAAGEVVEVRTFSELKRNMKGGRAARDLYVLVDGELIATYRRGERVQPAHGAELMKFEESIPGFD